VTGEGPVPAEERLKDIQAITDAELSRLDDRSFLTELIDRVREVLAADTAAVLLLDRSSGQLVATAAAGLDEEVNQGVRIPVGRGFAGHIAAERSPLIMNRVEREFVVNPILVTKGIKSLLGVPMLAGGTVLGVLHVGSLTPREFTSSDVELLQLAADRAATAVQSMTARTDRAATVRLQRSLLPSALPDVAGAQMAARFIPGNGVVGGDWYDVFLLPTGELCIAMGDVAGSGLSAAVVMGRMRSALRAYALETPDPAEVLRKLDTQMQHFEPDVLATVLYAVAEPSLDHMYISSAGHLPPVIAIPEQQTVMAEITADVMIGVAPGTERNVTTVKTPHGTLLCFYTDGLIERPRLPIDDGLTRLCQAVRPEEPEAACAAVMAAMIGQETTRDDIAVLMLRRV
jgi:phosphoserine phosphatase RsbU/P